MAQEVRGNVVQVDKRKIGLGVDLDEGQILLGVARDVVGVVNFSIIHRHLDFQISRALHDMLVGDDISRWIDDEARAEALQSLPDFSGMAPVIAKVLRCEIFEGIADPAPDDPLRIDVNDCGQNLGHRLHRRLCGRVSLGEEGWGRNGGNKEGSSGALRRPPICPDAAIE